MASLIVALSILTIDAGYLFEGVGIPLGRFEFGSGTLTRPVPPGHPQRPHSKNRDLLYATSGRSGRIASAAPLLAGLPCRCPSIICWASTSRRSRPKDSPTASSGPIEALRRRRCRAGPARGRPRPTRRVPRTPSTSTASCGIRAGGITTSATLLYKVPEGTWLLVAALAGRPALAEAVDGRAGPTRSRSGRVPVVVLFSMSFLTDINLGLRYVLSDLALCLHRDGQGRPVGEAFGRPPAADRRALVGRLAGADRAPPRLGSIPITWPTSTGPRAGPIATPARLIDSNLDWGQDLVGLQRWCRRNIGR